MAAQCEEGFVLHISFVSISRPSADRFDSQAHECDNSLEELYGYAADGAGGQGVLSDLSEVLAVAGHWESWVNSLSGISTDPRDHLDTFAKLIDDDLLWNPSWLEQRLGRIKRFGQTRQFVDMLNLVYADNQGDPNPVIDGHC